MDYHLEPIYKQLCADTGCSQENDKGAMDDRDGGARNGQGDPCKQRDVMMMRRRIGDDFKQFCLA